MRQERNETLRGSYGSYAKGLSVVDGNMRIMSKNDAFAKIKGRNKNAYRGVGGNSY